MSGLLKLYFTPCLLLNQGCCARRKTRAHALLPLSCLLLPACRSSQRRCSLAPGSDGLPGGGAEAHKQHCCCGLQGGKVGAEQLQILVAVRAAGAAAVPAGTRGSQGGSTLASAACGRQVHPGLHRQPLVLQHKSSSRIKAAEHASHLHPCRQTAAASPPLLPQTHLRTKACRAAVWLSSCAMTGSV